MSVVSILFYSPKCPHSIKCLQMIEPNKDKFSFIEYVDIHQEPDNLPNLLQRVPTLVISKNDNTTNPLVLVGKEVFKWVYETTKSFEKSLTYASDLKGIGDSSTCSSISDIGKNLSDTINYNNIQMNAPVENKISITPEMIMARRETELHNLRV